VQVQRDHLDRLPEAHVVGEAAAEPGVAHAGQPGHPALLVRAQRRHQAGRRVQSRRGGGQPGDPAGEVGQRALRDDRHRLAVDLTGPGQHGAERLRRAHPCLRRAAQPGQQRRVERHPPAAQPDQRPLRLGQLSDLLGVQQLAAERQLPPELQQRLQVEPGLGHLLRRGRDRPQSQAAGQQAGRPQHLDAGPGEVLGGRAQESGDRIVVELEHCRAGLGQHLAQRRPRRGTAPQRQQQVGFGLCTEPGEDPLRLVPQIGGVDDQARVGGTAQLQHQPERRRDRARAGGVGSGAGSAGFGGVAGRLATGGRPSREVRPARPRAGPGRGRDSAGHVLVAELVPVPLPAAIVGVIPGRDLFDPQTEARAGGQAAGRVRQPLRQLADRGRLHRGEEPTVRGAAAVRTSVSAIASHRSRISDSADRIRIGRDPGTASACAAGGNAPASRRSHTRSAGSSGPTRQASTPPAPTVGSSRPRATRPTPAVAAAAHTARLRRTGRPPGPVGSGSTASSSGSASATGSRVAETSRLRMPYVPPVKTSSIRSDPAPAPHSASDPARGTSFGTKTASWPARPVNPPESLGRASTAPP
jgi:hypothetical protein